MAKNNIVDLAEDYFHAYIRENDDIYRLDRHLVQVNKWAKKLLEENPEADSEVVLLAVWLHDIAHYPPKPDNDHAVNGELITRKYLLSNNYPSDRIEAVAHCVRSHRCKDIMPKTLEAKILVCADSASHLTDQMYLDIAKEGRVDYALGKLERDYRDIGAFPKIQKELKPKYESWKKILEEINK